MQGVYWNEEKGYEMRKNVVCVLILFIISMFFTAMPIYAEGQSAPQTFTVQQLKEDTDFFFKTIEDTHPDIYFKISKEDYDYYKQLCYEKINKPMPAEEYYKVLAEFLNKFGDGHTRINFSEKSAGAGLMPPFLTEWIDGQLVITKVFGTFPVKKSDVILYINDVSAQEYMDSIIKYKSYNDYQSARKKSSGMSFLNNFVLEPQHELVIKTSNKKVFKWNVPLFSKKDTKIFEEYYIKPKTIKLTSNISIPDKPFEFSLWKELNVGYLKWNIFLDRQCYKFDKYSRGEKIDINQMKLIPDFSEMLKKSFEQINSNKVKYLIIDIRGNGGGDSTLGKQFLNYIIDKNKKLNSTKTSKIKLSELLKTQRGEDGFYKFLFAKFPMGTVIDESKLNESYSEYEKSQKNNPTIKEPDFFNFPKIEKKFKGKFVLLIDNYVFSSAELFAVICKDNNIAVIIGEPTGGGVTNPGDVLFFILPNSKFAGSVSHKIFVREDESRINERAVYPDYYVYQTLEDFRAGKDTVLEFVKQGIKENKF